MSASAIAIAIAGGALIGLGASLLLLFTGRLAGLGGIVAGLLQGSPGERGWRAAFVAGLIAGGIAFSWARPGAFSVSQAALPVLLLAGGAVGFGTRLGGGCTSGHGICGVSRLSRRAILATMTFMGTGAAVVALVRALGGPR
jgi:uncharacterized membrane protein YedE/YeeE